MEAQRMPTVAVVTGANQGIGHAVVAGLVPALGPAGMVYLTGRDRQPVERAASEIPCSVPAVLDVRDTVAVETFAGLVGQRHGGVDIVISNAAARRTRERGDTEQVRGFGDARGGGPGPRTVGCRSGRSEVRRSARPARHPDPLDLSRPGGA
jgi:carbonyl reductase 1